MNKSQWFDERNLRAQNRNYIELSKLNFTEDQKSLLLHIAKMRHDIKITSPQVFSAESEPSREFFNFVENINDKLICVGLPVIEFSVDFEDIEIDGFWYEGVSDHESIEEAREATINQVLTVVGDIEKYLKDNTNIAPSGKWREQHHNSHLRCI